MKNSMIKEIKINSNGEICLQNLSLESVIIDEKIHRDISYQRLFEHLKEWYNNHNLSIFKFKSCFDLIEFFPLNSIEYKTLKKSYKHHTVLNILICDKENFNNVLEMIKKVTYNELTAEQLYVIYTSLHSSNGSLTYKVSDQNILIFLPINFTLSDLRHEFIHYMQFLTNDAKLQYDVNVPKDFLPDHIVKTLENVFNINKTICTYFENLAEYEPLVNDAFDELREFKNRYYADMSDLEFARFIDNILFRQNLLKSSPGSYLTKLIEYEYFDELIDFENLGLKLVIYFNVLGYRIRELEHLLYGYFSKPLKPKY